MPACAHEGPERNPDRNAASNIAFYSMVLSNLRAQDMKELLVNRGIEPVGAKNMLAQLVVSHLAEDDVEQFVLTRSKKPRVDAPSGSGGGQSGRQGTLDAMFSGAGQAD